MTVAGTGTKADSRNRTSTRKVRNTASPADQEAAILAAAAAEFAEVGVRRANIDEVAARAGVSRSTLYRRFPNKDALLYAVANDAYETGMQKLEASVKGRPVEPSTVEPGTLAARNDDGKRVVVVGEVLLLAGDDAGHRGVGELAPAEAVEGCRGHVCSSVQRRSSSVQHLIPPPPSSSSDRSTSTGL